jgi:hypothetical protein
MMCRSCWRAEIANSAHLSPAGRIGVHESGVLSRGTPCNECIRRLRQGVSIETVRDAPLIQTSISLAGVGTADAASAYWLISSRTTNRHRGQPCARDGVYNASTNFVRQPSRGRHGWIGHADRDCPGGPFPVLLRSSLLSALYPGLPTNTWRTQPMDGRQWGMVGIHVFRCGCR